MLRWPVVISADLQSRADEYAREGLPPIELSPLSNDALHAIEKINGAISSTSAIGRNESMESRERNLHAHIGALVDPATDASARRRPFPIFSISHFARAVDYSVHGLLGDNIVGGPLQVEMILHKPEMALWSDLPALDLKAKARPLLDTFRSEMAAFASDLERATCQWIKCIKLVNAKETEVAKMSEAASRSFKSFDHDFVRGQLESTGIAETVKVYAAGYTTRLPHVDVVER